MPVANAWRSALAAAAGSAASRIARTAQSRSAPAATTCAALPGSMPPIAKKGCGACAAAWAISSSPTPGRPAFVGVSQIGPTLM